MPLNSPISQHNQAKRKLLWLQIQEELLNEAQSKQNLRNTYVDSVHDTELNEKGDGDDLSDCTSSLEDGCLSDCSGPKDGDCIDENDSNDAVYDNTTHCSFLDKPQDIRRGFEVVKRFLIHQSKPSPLVIKVLKSFIRSQEVGKSISRGIQAEINLNLYNYQKPFYKNFLDELYAPLKDVYNIDVIENNDRPTTVPIDKKAKSEICSTFHASSDANVISIVSKEILYKLNENNKKKISHIPKLIRNKNSESKKVCKLVKSQPPAVKQVPNVASPTVLKPNERLLQLSRENSRSSKASSPTSQTRPNINEQVSRIPVPDKLGEIKINTVIQDEPIITESKFSFDQNSDSSWSISEYGCNQTVVEAIPKQQIKVDLPHKQLSEFKLLLDDENSVSFKDSIESVVPVKVNNETSNSNSFAKEEFKINNSDISPKEKTKQKLASKELKAKSKYTTNITFEAPDTGMFPLDTLKYNKNQKPKIEKCLKKEKPKQMKKPVKKYNERFIKDNKVTYVLNDEPCNKKVKKTNQKRRQEKSKVQDPKPSPNYLEQRRNSCPADKYSTFLQTKVSKFASFPRKYEEIKRNRSKQKTYVLVKNTSLAHLHFSSNGNQPFKVVPLQTSSMRSCENSPFSLLTKSPFWNSYSYVLGSPNDMTNMERKSQLGDLGPDAVHMLSDTILMNSAREDHYYNSIEDLLSMQEIKIVKKTNPIIPSSPDNRGYTSYTSNFTDRYEHDSNPFLLLNSSCSPHSSMPNCVRSKHRNDEWSTSSSHRLEEWVKNMEKTETTLNKLRKRISSLNTLLRNTSRKQLSENVEQQFSRPVVSAPNTRHCSSPHGGQYACDLTENNQRKHQMYKLPNQQTKCSSAFSEGTTNPRKQGGLCNVPREPKRCPCRRFQQSTLSHSDKFPCMPSVPLHLLVPRAVI